MGDSFIPWAIHAIQKGNPQEILSGPSLVPRPLPDFIPQPWRKLGEGLESLLCHGPEMVDLVSM